MTSVLHARNLTAPPRRDLVLVDEGRRHDLRWRPGDRLEHLFEQRCSDGLPDAPCVETGGESLTYRELDTRANRLARHLLARRIGPGHRVALLFDDPIHAYVAMLAVLKAGAAYVPLDPGFPTDRIAYIVADADASAVLTLTHLRRNLTLVRALVVAADDMAERISAEPGDRIGHAERGPSVDQLAYIIYTSGSTGRPKGVAVEHPSIVNFIRVAAEVYGIRPQDRVYQGLTIAFDFSFEEIWVPWAVGATLVPKPGGSSLLGVDLHAFLTERRVTAMCCVPTLLATLEEDLPLLRFLLVSGEACPQDLITRWHRADRRFLNVYGPTEATVTATWTTLHPDRPVSIGQPLPTYATVVLDQEDPMRALPHGEIGEIGIAGIGLAAGYLNRDDLTAKAFIPDFLNLLNNPSGRIYRTGDLGRVNAAGEIEYLGRIDMQVKIRGYRIELTEIESVLLQVPGIAAAVVDTFEPTPGTLELVGYYSLRSGMDSVAPEVITAHLREQLPPYMVPSYLEHLDAIPMTTSDKADRKALPPPKARRTAGSAAEQVAADSETEHLLADALGRTLGLDAVSVDSHFFDDLGANSLLMAQFSALVRSETALPALSMRAIYGHPTIRRLARQLGDVSPAAAAPRPVGGVVRTSTAGYWMVGTLQLLTFAGALYLGALLLVTGLSWAWSAPTQPEVFGRSAAFTLGAFLAACLLPILAKWLLIGRFRPREIRLWSLGHFRFWLVKTLIRANPLVLFGGPVYNLYLRCLGAQIGRGVTVLAGTVPVATDLIKIGDHTIIRRDSSFAGYRAMPGKIEIGPVTIGREVFVGEKTALDIGSSIGDGAQLGHTSSLPAGQHIPAGERWHGAPAEPTPVDYRVIGSGHGCRLRRFLYGTLQLLGALLVAPVLGAIAVAVASAPTSRPIVEEVVTLGHGLLPSPALYGWTAAITAALFAFGVLTGLATMILAPRVLSLLVRPARVYPLFGIRWIIAQAITRLGNSEFYMTLLGDSSAIVHYLQALGYRMPRLEQTGSNFGTELKQDAALLTTIGSGTMVSDSLSIMNADFSAGSFRLSEVAIRSQCFLGNNIAYPANAKVGRNVLLGSKVMVPTSGPIREDVGLLGSPCFEIPRTVARDTEFDYLKEPGELGRRLRRKNRHNAVSMLLFLTARWVQVFVSTLLVVTAVDLFRLFGIHTIPAALTLIMILNILIAVLVERLVLGFQPLRPRFVSIYDPYFWRHERLWKLGFTNRILNGTPFKNIIWRLLGVRIGRRVFDDGCAIPEKTLVIIGNDAVLNAGSLIQCHSLEDGSFKSDHTSIGAGAAIGVDTFVHYGVTMGHGSILEVDSFLMKGETMPPFAVWHGNPATEVRGGAPVGGVATDQGAASADGPVRVKDTGPVGATDPVELPAGSIPRQPGTRATPSVPAARTGSNGSSPPAKARQPSSALGQPTTLLPINGGSRRRQRFAGNRLNGPQQTGQSLMGRPLNGELQNGRHTQGRHANGQPNGGHSDADGFQTNAGHIIGQHQCGQLANREATNGQASGGQSKSRQVTKSTNGSTATPTVRLHLTHIPVQSKPDRAGTRDHPAPPAYEPKALETGGREPARSTEDTTVMAIVSTRRIGQLSDGPAASATERLPYVRGAAHTTDPPTVQFRRVR